MEDVLKIKPVSIILAGLSFLGGLALVLGLLFCLDGWAQPARAQAAVQQAELTVCASGCDFDNLQEAAFAAGSGDVIKVAGGVYTGVQTVNGL